MNLRAYVRLFSALLTTCVLASCSRSPVTSPAGAAASWQPAALQAGLARFDQILSHSAFRSFQSAGSALEASTPASAFWLKEEQLRALSSPSRVEIRRVAGDLVARLMASSQARGAQPVVPVISPDYYGRTFVYDPAQHRYVSDPERSGAPANGVRYILYAIDSTSHEPIEAQEVGYADVTDEGTQLPNGFALRLRAVAGDLNFLDYSVAVLAGAGAGAVHVHGFMTDGHERADFHIDLDHREGDGQQAFDVGFGFQLRQQPFSVSAVAHGVSSNTDDAQHIEQAVQIGRDVIHLAASVRDQNLEAVIAVNDHLLAHTSGPPARPTIVGADGHPLSPEEMAALDGILNLVDNVFRLLGDLLKPIDAIWALSQPA